MIRITISVRVSVEHYLRNLTAKYPKLEESN